MIKINLEKYLEQEERSLRWVSSKTGIALTTLININHNKTKSVSFDVLEKLCDLFNCEISDMIIRVKDDK